ncbi:MAG: GNAT family N-acetyltransferase [Thermomicrobiales bacterium]
MPKTLRLIPPDSAYRESVLEGLREFQTEPRFAHLDLASVAADFPAYVASQRARTDAGKLPPDQAPETVLWLMEGETFIGRLSIRNTHDEALIRTVGHIGHMIRPSKRRMGYGTMILALALPEAKALGLARVLVTCDEDNIASRTIIERNGGHLEGATPSRTGPGCTLRFWIDLG